jgi:hypothetical protein
MDVIGNRLPYGQPITYQWSLGTSSCRQEGAAQGLPLGQRLLSHEPIFHGGKHILVQPVSA